MLKSVKAEFDGFDSAESASRKIRKNINGIRKIKITSHGRNSGNDYYFRLIPTAVVTQNYITDTVISPADTSNESKIMQTAFLTVICTEEAALSVHNILVSSGGMSVSSETFIP